jgi:TfoX/Sxy family transcriptional regulator of competence genes
MGKTVEEKIALYEALIATHPEVVRKGKKTPYTSMNGNMFSFLGQQDVLAFRLAKADRAAFLEKYPDSVVVQYDTVMKDYVEVPDELLDDPEALAALFAQVVANARTLKPKPTTRKKKKA